MRSTSEYVSIGHPDKVCDYISSYLLDRYLEKDPQTRFAVEVQMKDNYVTLGGEITSKVKFPYEDIFTFVKKAISEIGYNDEYVFKWGNENVPNAETIILESHISEQSPDISKGVDAKGWGDQGIFWGMAVPDKATNYLPKDIFVARSIGYALYEKRVAGIDIKTQVSCVDGCVNGVIVAIPCREYEYESVEDAVREVISHYYSGDDIIINGTGAYVRHGSVGDCGTTGRKLAVDFYGGNCRIGGGSPWTKDATKADLTLNLYARKLALEAMRKYNRTVYVSLSCCIGRDLITVDVYDENNETLESYNLKSDREQIIADMDLRSPNFAERCKKGLFYYERPDVD